MTSQQCNTNPYLMVVLHACIHAPMVRLQPKLKIVRSANGSTEYGKLTFDLQIALSASSKNTRCATSDVNPFKIRCNLQIIKATDRKRNVVTARKGATTGGSEVRTPQLSGGPPNF